MKEFVLYACFSFLPVCSCEVKIKSIQEGKVKAINGSLKEPGTSTHLSCGPFCLLAQGCHSVYGAEVQLLQLALVKSQSNMPQRGDLVFFPVGGQIPNL